jgi:hypothetical protein
MSAKTLRSEIKRLTSRIGADEPPITLITIAVVDASDSAEPMDFPGIVGHTLSYRIQGEHETFFFPFTEMNSEQAEELAQAIILYTRETERLGRLFPAGILNMTLEPDYSLRVSLPPAGVPMKQHAAELYRQVIEGRHESAQTH